MHSFGNWAAVLADLLPVLLVIAVVTVMARLAHWLIRCRQGKSRESDPFPCQFVTLIAVIIAIISVVLVMPVEVSVRNRLVTLLGVLVMAIIAFSSTSFAASILAGFVLRATRRLRPGNLISLDGDPGRITAIGLIQTEIQTQHRNFTCLPNTALLSGKVTVINPEATIVSAGVSLGYDVHHTVVEKQLLRAAEKCGLEDPHVRITELGDFSISYRVAGTLREVQLLTASGSDLRKSMLDCLHEAGIGTGSRSCMKQRPLSPEQAGMPRPADRSGNPGPASASGASGSLVFDKADEDERVEDLKDHREQLLARVRELEADPGMLDGSRKTRAKQEIEACNARLRGLNVILRSKEE